MEGVLKRWMWRRETIAAIDESLDTRRREIAIARPEEVPRGVVGHVGDEVAVTAPDRPEEASCAVLVNCRARATDEKLGIEEPGGLCLGPIAEIVGPPLREHVRCVPIRKKIGWRSGLDDASGGPPNATARVVVQARVRAAIHDGHKPAAR